MVEHLPIKDYAKLNHISEHTVRRLIHSGRLPFVMFGNVYRIPSDAIPSRPEEKHKQIFKDGEFSKMLDSLVF